MFSAEGTLAHLIAETILRTGISDTYFLDRQFECDGFVFTVDREFLDHVQVYVTYVENLRAVGMSVVLEQQVTILTGLPVALFGTADCVAYDKDGITVVDLKFGKGKQVDPVENPQLLYYAAGTLLLSYLRGRFTRDTPVRLVIVQPRIPHADGVIHGWTTTAGHIADWLDNELRPGVARALDDDGATLVPGPYCQFCPVFKDCPGPTDQMRQLAMRLFADGEDVPADPNLPDPLMGIGKTVSDDRLSEILDAALVVEPLIEAARNEAKARIKAGAHFGNWEVIQRKGKRDWGGTAGMLFALLAQRGENPLNAAVLKTPAALEKDDPRIYRLLSSHVTQAPPVDVLQQAGRTRQRAPTRLSPP